VRIKGRVHSVETMGTADGPGLRIILFLQGCPLRCRYCHNPDTWNPRGGTAMTVSQSMKTIIKYKPYFSTTGGLTLSGGEPLTQAKYASQLFYQCKQHGIHTTLDTSGCMLNPDVKRCLKYTDLVLLDVKHFEDKKYKWLTGSSLNHTLKILDYLLENNIPVWIRHVIVPEFNDTIKDIRGYAALLKPYKRIIEKTELLPYHTMGVDKWKKLGIKYAFKNIKDLKPQKVNKLQQLLG